MRIFADYFCDFTLAIEVTGVSPFLAQPPANDSDGGAFVISGLPYNFAQDTRLATPDPTDPILFCADSGGGNPAGFVDTADSTRFVRFSTSSSTPDAGYHAVKISADHLASGVYYYRITAGSLTSTRKMILIR